MFLNTISTLNEALQRLRRKYAIAADGVLLADSSLQLATEAGLIVPLLPWRVERRFTELKTMIDQAVITEVSTYRFWSAAPNVSLEQLLVRELDLAEFFSGSMLQSGFAVLGSDACCNLVAQLANGCNCSIECATLSAASAPPVDRHEIIARRGVASDQVVDTQIPQSSIYCFQDTGKTVYTDVDMELFGLTPPEVWLVRAALAVLKEEALANAWRQRMQTLRRMVDQLLADAAKTQVTQFNH